jgi:ferredoxin
MGDPGPLPPVFSAIIEPRGARFDAPAGETLLISASNAGLDVPSSCRNGSCRTCICRLVDGEVAYRIEWPGVLPEEKALGYILPCVAYPRSDLVLEWPAA